MRRILFFSLVLATVFDGVKKVMEKEREVKQNWQTLLPMSIILGFYQVSAYINSATSLQKGSEDPTEICTVNCNAYAQNGDAFGEQVPERIRVRHVQSSLARKRVGFRF